MKPFRSVLYLPGNKPRVLEKAAQLPCDAIIIDLEDAVPPADKDEARANAIHALTGIDYGHRTVILRVNGFGTPWAEADLAAARGAAQAVLLPKVSDAETLNVARRAIGDRPAIWAMIETCAGVLRIDAIGSAAKENGLAGFVVGTNDLAKEMRCQMDEIRSPVRTALSTTVMAARAYGLVAIDGVCNRLKDISFLSEECRQGAMLGFDGKSLIHPEQIEPANAVFRPDEEQIAQASAIVDAFADPANQGLGVITVNGKMAELLHLEEARRVLAVEEGIKAFAQ